MGTFENFASSIREAGNDGKAFERFSKWFLENDPEWSSLVDRVWLWDEYPDRWGRDCGVDLVFQHKDGSHWAVQAKCYDSRYSVTKSDIDKFLSQTNRARIGWRQRIGGELFTRNMCIHWVHFSSMKKDVGMRIRVDRDLRDDFVAACQSDDKPAAQVIREFMRSYVADHPASTGKQETGKRSPHNADR